MNFSSKLTLNVLLSLIFQSKITGKGLLGNGKIFVKLLETIADCEVTSATKEWSVLSIFSDECVKANAYQKVDKFLHKFLANKKKYPHEKFCFTCFEKSVGNWHRYEEFLIKMSKICNEVLDKTKVVSLVYSLLSILQLDNSITKIAYGDKFISKKEFFGSYAHPKKICLEMFLLGLLHQVHLNERENDCVISTLLPLPNRSNFHVVYYENTKNRLSSNDNSYLHELSNPAMPIDFERVLHETAKLLFAMNETVNPSTILKNYYSPQIQCDNKNISEIPKENPIFIYGIGGVGKTTFLLNQVRKNDDERVCFFLPLYQYQNETQTHFMSENCWIILQILLKYYYQYEYQSYDSCIACEGESTVLEQLTKLSQLFKTNLNGYTPRYSLYLDGFNEMSCELQDIFIKELNWICGEWKNVHLVVTGRVVPKYELFNRFQKLNLLGLSEHERNLALKKTPNYESALQNANLMELLKIPMFLNMYLENQSLNDDDSCINNRGELLNLYIANWGKTTVDYDNSVSRFIVQFALPFVSKAMLDSRRFELDKASLLEAIDKAFEIYLLNERIFQNYIAPKKIRKKALLESREKDDFVELISENICFMTTSNSLTLRFTHQYFRDYFAAKHILNFLEALDLSYGDYFLDEQEKMFNHLNLGAVWFHESEEEIYKLIGEISGDYRNYPNEDFWYHETVLDSLLDMSRKFNTFRTTENIIRTMCAARGGVICGANFSGTNLPSWIPCHIKFSLDGKYPSRFEDCVVLSIGAYNSQICCSTGLVDGNLILLALEDGYVVLWDNMQEKIRSDYNLSAYTEQGLEFEAACFLDNDNVLLTSFRSTIRLELTTGSVSICDSEKIDTEPFIVTETLRLKIYEQFNHFKNCDFSGAKFISVDDNKENLRIIGALVE